jgi:uncharacterized protein YheU (UPF0270 family)
MTDFIEIPPGQLNAETLQAVIEEFITREGTDYGMEDYSLEQKVHQIKCQLDRGEVLIVFDPLTETCTLRLRQSLQ